MTLSIRRAAFGGASLVVVGLAASSAAAAELRGRVTDQATGAALPGAEVIVDGRQAVAGPDGRFEIDGLADGPHEATVRYVGYSDHHQTVSTGDVEAALTLAGADVDELVVTGQRAAERRALQVKRSADNEVDALQANDVGKLPDQNVAEAVRRLPGVSVANDQGEGRYVIIRGVNPNLANVTLNGQNAPAPEPEGRQVKLDDIPSSIIGSVQISKTLTPDLDANAIAGQVDISTLSAFDRSRPFVYARGAYGTYQLNGKNPYEGDVTVGGQMGPENQFGVVVAGNYSRRPIESENFGASAPTYRLVNGFVVPDLQNIRDYELVRTRAGLVANLDWRPNPNVHLFLRGTYSKFTDHETRDQFRIDNESSFSAQTATTGAFKGRGGRYVRSRNEDDNTKNLAFGGAFDLPVGSLKLEGVWSRAEKIDPLRSEWLFRTSGSLLNVTYDTADRFYLFTPDANAYDPSKYTANQVNYDHRQAVETLWQGRADYTVPLNAVGRNSTLQVGFKIQSLDKTNNRDFQVFTASGFTLADTSPLTDPTSVYDGRYLFGPRVNYAGVEAYVAAHPSVLTQSASNKLSSLTNSLVNDYAASEDIYAGYLMATLKFGALTVIPGVRVEGTHGDYKAKKIVTGATVDDPFNVFGRFAYTNAFPGVNLRFDVNDRLVLRAAATTAIGRPNYSDLAPYVSVQDANTLALGNADLKALKAVNLDAAAEYYLPGQGVLSVSGFYKHIDHPIFTATRTPTTAEVTAYGVATTAVVTQPINVDSGEIHGVELNAQSQFGFLPSPFDGLGASANVTFVSARATGVPGRTGDVPMALQSDRVGTLQLFYEKYGFAARLAYSFRSKYLLALGGSAATDQWVDDYQSLDARASYAFNKHFTVFMEGANLTNEPYRIWVGDRSQMIENERYGYTLRGGLQLAF